MGNIIEDTEERGAPPPPLPLTLCYKFPFSITKSFFYNSVVELLFLKKIANIFQSFKLLSVYSSYAEYHSNKRESAYIYIK